jgi:hypothetical protein
MIQLILFLIPKKFRKNEQKDLRIMAKENHRSKFRISISARFSFFIRIENEKQWQEVIVKMKMAKQLNIKKNQVIRNDQLE